MPPPKVSSDDFFATVPDDRKPAIQQLQATILAHLPKGFEEKISSSSINYVVPLAVYPAGYNNTKIPLGIMSIVSQKNVLTLHHLGLYADENLTNWFVAEYPKHSKTKLDMGKGCIRFKKMDEIPFQLIGDLAEKITPQQWIEKYETVFRKKK